MSAANSSDVLPTGAAPSPSRRALIPAALTASATLRSSFAFMDGGSPAGGKSSCAEATPPVAARARARINIRIQVIFFVSLDDPDRHCQRPGGEQRRGAKTPNYWRPPV